MNNKLLAVLAVVAVAFAAVAVFTEVSGSDADPTYEPTSFAYGYTADDATGVYKGMKVIGYADKVLLIDINAMNLTVSQNNYYVGLQLDTDENYTPDTEVIKDGYFHESEMRSAPYFDLQIDGITLLNKMF